MIELAHLPGRQQQAAQQHLQLLTLDQPLRERDLAVAQADFDAAQQAQVIFLAAHAALIAWRLVAQHLGPVDPVQHRFDLIGGVARGIQAADHRAHRGADDAVDRHALALEHLEHADMGRAAGTAAAKDQTGPGAVGNLCCGINGRGSGLRHRHERGARQRCQDEQPAAANTPRGSAGGVCLCLLHSIPHSPAPVIPLKRTLPAGPGEVHPSSVGPPSQRPMGRKPTSATTRQTRPPASGR
ncbi:hypothetical protein D3C71_1281930 [compost metagenome]